MGFNVASNNLCDVIVCDCMWSEVGMQRGKCARGEPRVKCNRAKEVFPIYSTRVGTHESRAKLHRNQMKEVIHVGHPNMCQRNWLDGAIAIEKKPHHKTCFGQEMIACGILPAAMFLKHLARAKSKCLSWMCEEGPWVANWVMGSIHKTKAGRCVDKNNS